MHLIIRTFMLGLALALPVLCRAQLNTPNKPATKPSTKPTTTQKPVEKKLYTDAGTVTDIDGNVYKCIKIGNQTWMAENLRTAHYNEGIKIPNVTDPWFDFKTGAWCTYNNYVSYDVKYGKLYNWYAVGTGKLAPSGWHVASDEDWQILIDYLGGEEEAGGKIKSALLWKSPNEGATNSSGFMGLPGGWLNHEGIFKNLTETGIWWSASKFDEVNAWCRSIHFTTSEIERELTSAHFGLSVRCIKD